MKNGEDHAFQRESSYRPRVPHRVAFAPNQLRGKNHTM
jgi:hypothetical protein